MVKNVIDYAHAITDANLGSIEIGGETFTGIGYQGLMTVNTKTYTQEPVRSNDGSIPNIEDYDTFIVPRCKVNFKYFNINDYMRLCRVLNSGNQFPVTFFDKQFGTRKTYLMYCEPEEMEKIYNCSTSILGVLDYEISFIGTLNDLPEYTISFSANGLTPKTISVYNSSTTYANGDVVKEEATDDNCYQCINEDGATNKPLNNTTYWKLIENPFVGSQNIKWGNSVKVPSAETLAIFYTIPSGKTFKCWNTLSTGLGYNSRPNVNWTVFENATLYAILESENNG